MNTLFRNGALATALESRPSALFLSPRGWYPLSTQKGQFTNSQTSSSNTIALPGISNEKCTHFTASGRRCRLRALRSGLCFRHAALQVQPAQPVDVDLSADFLIKLDDLQSADQINQFLAKLLILVVQNRISTRRASVMTYITNQLLHSLVAIEREVDSQPVQWERDLPVPDWGKPEETVPQSERAPCKPV